MGLKINVGKILSSSFMENNKDINEDEAMAKITQSELEIKAILDEKKNDDKLEAARDICKQLSLGYNASLKMEKAKIQFLLERIESLRDQQAIAQTDKPQ